MNLDMLRGLIAISDTGSFAKAAQDMYISSQGLNKAIASLESEIGHELVTRTARGTTLTEDGVELCECARAMIALYDSTLQSLDASHDERELLTSCDYLFATTSLCIERILHPMMTAGLLSDVGFREISPQVALEVAGKSDWVALMDFPMRRGDLVPVPEGSRFLNVAETKMGIVYDRGSLPDIGDVVSLQDIADLPLGLIDAPTMVNYVDRFFDISQSSHQIRRQTRHEQLLLGAAASGNLIMLFDSLSWSQVRGHILSIYPNLTFARVENHVCNMGFVIPEKDRNDAKRELVEAFANTYKRECIKYGWDVLS